MTGGGVSKRRTNTRPVPDAGQGFEKPDSPA